MWRARETDGSAAIVRERGAASSARMVLRVQLLQPLARDVRVDRRRRDVGVTEQQLHDAQVGAVVEQVRGERVPQHVRRQRRGGNAGA